MTVDEVINIFKRHGLRLARIYGSKSYYRERYPQDHIYFNANAITEQRGKIWFGDFHVERDSEALEEVAKELGERIYILREMDARFGEEEKPISELIEKAVYKTEFNANNE